MTNVPPSNAESSEKEKPGRLDLGAGSGLSSDGRRGHDKGLEKSKGLVNPGAWSGMLARRSLEMSDASLSVHDLCPAPVGAACDGGR